MNEVSFEENWNLMISGGRRIYRDDIISIDLSDSDNTYLIRLKTQSGLMAHLKSNCHFYYIQ